MLKKFWQHLTNETLETKRQILGFRALFVLLTLVIVSPILWHQFIPEPKDNDFARQELDSLKYLYLRKIDSLDRLQSGITYQKPANSFKQNTFKNYPIIDKPKNVVNNQIAQTIDINKKVYPKHAFNINTASEEDFMQVSGIGKAFANRIVSFRDKLGGFYHQNQLFEVYNLDSSVVQKVFLLLTDEPLETVKIEINKATFKALLKHPYIKYEDVKVIFNHKPIMSKEMLCRILPDKCEKMSFYLTYID